jgi:predicted DNA-binding transcriptional regulator YafY
MRADRLLSLLMLLQTRGRMTAEALARELEVSERTIYRDLEALSAAGVPVYAERGPGGGCGLLDSYRTTLTGLTEAEARALFMVSIPAPLEALGIGRELRSALLKLSASLPAARRADEERTRSRIHLDWSPEPGMDLGAPHLPTIQQTVWQDRRLLLRYRLWEGVEVEQEVEPYGLVARGGVWNLVYCAHGSVRVRRLSDLLDARATDAAFERPPDFDLAAFWKAWRAEHHRPVYSVSARLAPEAVRFLPLYLGEAARQALTEAPAPDADGWLTLSLTFDSLEAARARLLALGGAVEVLKPEALRLSLADFGAQIAARHAPRANPSTN